MVALDSIQVIYIENSLLHVELLRAGLSVYNIEVVHLANGSETLIEELSLSRYDSAEVFIIEVNIGEISGLQVARRLRASGDSRPILMISSDEKPSQSALMAIQGMFIPKPFDFDWISEKIKKLTARA
ncbi:MAG: response regulator [Chloroflexota bacterium]